MNILEALKKYIRVNGGSSRANNISEAVRDLDSIPQGSGGGAMIVHFELDESTGAVSADKTPSEVLTAMLSGPVIGVLTLSDSVYPVGSAFASVDGRFIAFYEPAGESGVIPVMSGSVQLDVWEVSA